MDDWRRTQLGDVITLQRGFDLPKQKRREGKVPVVSSSGVTGTHAEARVEPPGVVTGRYGTIGEVFYLDEPFWPLNTTLWVKEFNGNDPRFISYLLKTLNFAEHSDKSSVPGINRNHLHSIEVRVPGVSEQRAIAIVLATIDDKIALNRRVGQALNQLVKTVFRARFVEFDDATELVDSAIGPIPAGWQLEEIGSAVRVVGGGTPSTAVEEYWAGGSHHWATPKDLSRLELPVLRMTERQLTDAGLAKVSSGLLPKGTVLLSSRAPIGYLAVANVPVAINQGFIAMVCDQALPNHYVLRWAEAVMDEIVARANGTTFLEISKRNFRPMLIPVPSPSLLREFMELAAPIHDRMAVLESETERLIKLRDTLVPKLISGEMRVPADIVGEWTEQSLPGASVG